MEFNETHEKQISENQERLNKLISDIEALKNDGKLIHQKIEKVKSKISKLLDLINPTLSKIGLNISNINWDKD